MSEKEEDGQNRLILVRYKFSFHDDVEPVLSTGKGRRSFVSFLSQDEQNGCWVSNPTRLSRENADDGLGGSVSEINFDDLIYYQKASDKPAKLG